VCDEDLLLHGKNAKPFFQKTGEKRNSLTELMNAYFILGNMFDFSFNFFIRVLLKKTQKI